MGFYLLNKAARSKKSIVLITILTGLLLSISTYGQTVSGVSVSPLGPYCEGDNITVSFTLSGGLTWLSIGTTFEIVNNTGASVFADITPATTPVYTSNGTYTINLSIPYGGSIAGGNRRIRVTNYYWLFATLSSDALSASFTISLGSVGGAVSAAQTICSGSIPAALTLTGYTGSVVKWQQSANSTFAGASDISSTSTTLNGSSIGPLTANTYIRAVVQNGSCPAAYSAPVLITINTINPGSIQKGATNPRPGCSPRSRTGRPSAATARKSVTRAPSTRCCTLPPRRSACGW